MGFVFNQQIQSIRESVELCYIQNIPEPVHSGRDGADEPPTLIKEDLLSSGTARRRTSDTQASQLYVNYHKQKQMQILLLIKYVLHIKRLLHDVDLNCNLILFSLNRTN